MASGIHATAVISSTVELSADVEVGPYAVIEGPTVLGPGVRIGPHAIVHGRVLLAAGVQVGAHAVLGGEPQDLSYRGAPTCLEVGRGTVIREAAILHRSTDPERPTRVGAHCVLMGQSHVAHDCQLDDQVILSHGAGLAGHVTVGVGAVIGGKAGVHQHVRIGQQSMVGGMAAVVRDVLPFCLADGVPARHRRLNTLGLERGAIDPETHRALCAAFGRLRDGQEIDDGCGGDAVLTLRVFLAESSPRGISTFHH